MHEQFWTGRNHFLQTDNCRGAFLLNVFHKKKQSKTWLFILWPIKHWFQICMSLRSHWPWMNTHSPHILTFTFRHTIPPSFTLAPFYKQYPGNYSTHRTYSFPYLSPNVNVYLQFLLAVKHYWKDIFLGV